MLMAGKRILDEGQVRLMRMTAEDEEELDKLLAVALANRRKYPEKPGAPISMEQDLARPYGDPWKEEVIHKEGSCSRCGKAMKDIHWRRRFCSKECLRATERERRVELRKIRKQSGVCVRCGRKRAAKGLMCPVCHAKYG